jgi:hypothetical protein
LKHAIDTLRAAGETVVAALPGCDRDTGVDRQLVLRDGRWQVEPINAAAH